MSTRSRIGIERENGKIESIYCHFDGYIEGVGAILFNFYDREKTEELLKGGSTSSLHSIPSKCKTYKKRGESLNSYKSIEINPNDNIYELDWSEYLYVLGLDDKWRVKNYFKDKNTFDLLESYNEVFMSEQAIEDCLTEEEDYWEEI